MKRQFDLEEISDVSEEDVIRVLAQRISEMLDSEPDLLFSTLYRLDVYETKINAVINSPGDTAHGLASLVVERQKQKLETRNNYSSGGYTGDFFDIE